MTRVMVAALAATVQGGCMVAAGGIIDGNYTGRGVLQMTVVTPSYRPLPIEETNSFVAVRSAGNGRLLVNVRFNANGNQCSLNASQYGSGFVIDPGQLCRGLMRYGEYLVDSVLRVSEGRAVVSGALLNLQMQGTVVAEHRDGSHNTGVARWSIEVSR